MKYIWILGLVLMACGLVHLLGAAVCLSWFAVTGAPLNGLRLAMSFAAGALMCLIGMFLAVASEG